MIRIEELSFIKDRKGLLLFLGGLLCVCAVVYLKEWRLPRILIFMGGAFASLTVFVWGLKDAEVPLYTLLAYLPFSGRFSGGFSQASLFHPLTLLMIFVGILWWCGKYRLNEDELEGSEAERKRQPAVIWLMLAFWVWACFSIFRLSFLGMSYLGPAFAELIWRWGIPFLFYIGAFHLLRKEKSLKTAALILCAVTVLIGFLAAYEYFDTGERAGGIFAHPNRSAAFFNYAMFLPFAVFLLNYKRLWGWGFFRAFLICLRGLMVTLSRGGYVAFAVAVYVITFFRSKWLFLLLLMVTGIVLLNPQFLPEGVRWRLGKTIEASQGPAASNAAHLDRSSRDRLVIWEATVQLIKKNPLLGAGYGRYREKIQNYWYAGIPFDAHNTFLQTGAEMGIPAAVILAGLFVMIFLTARRGYLASRDVFLKACCLGLLGGLGGFVVSHLYVSRLDFPEITGYFWFLAGMSARIYRMEKAKRESVETVGQSSVCT